MTRELRPASSDHWMVIYTTFHIHEAQIVAGRLESEGIPAMVHQQAGASAMGIHIGRLGEINVLVRPDSYAQAQDILFPDAPDELPDDVDQIIFGDEEDTDYEE